MPNQSDDSFLHENQSGFALAGVLWAVMILSLMAVIITGLSRSSSSIVDIHIRRVQTDALLEAGINQLTLALLDPRSPWKADGKQHRMQFHEETLLLSAHYERGKIDLNHAPEELLTALFRVAGSPPGQAAILAKGIIDWRSPGNDYPPPVTNPSEALAHTNATNPLQSASEVQRVKGMSDNLYCRIAPFITVYAQQRDVDAMAASGLALEALAQLGIRSNGTQQTPSAVGGSDLSGEAITLRAELTSSGSLRKGLPGRVKEVVIRLTGDIHQPVWYLSMHEDMNQGADCATIP